jgi:hypothetical protein
MSNVLWRSEKVGMASLHMPTLAAPDRQWQSGVVDVGSSTLDPQVT